MSQAVGQDRDLTKSFTLPKMYPGSISSATKLPERKVSAGENSVKVLWLRSFTACSLAAQVAAASANTIETPNTSSKGDA